MMTKTQYILGKIAEECCEIAQRALKASRFGLNEVQKGQTLTNAQRLIGEVLDLAVALEVLENDGLIKLPEGEDLTVAMMDRHARLQHYLDYSRSLGEVE